MAIVVHLNGSLIIGSLAMPPVINYPNLPGLQGKVNKHIIVRCFPNWYREINLEWDIPKQWGNCAFNVFFSPHESGDFVQLNKYPLTSPFYADTSTLEYSKTRHGFYRVEVILIDKGITCYSVPSTWQVRRRSLIELKASEIQRREYLLLTKFTGVKSFLFKRRPYGLRCPRCWNVELEKVMDDHCPICLGTSYEHGYFNPITIYPQYDPTPLNLAKSYFGSNEVNQLGAWTIAIPGVEAEDILIRSGDWSVYTVGNISATELLTVPVRQMMQLSQLSKFDVEYQLLKRTSAPSTYLDNVAGDFVEKRMPVAPIDLVTTNDYAWAPGNKAQTLPVKYNLPDVAPTPTPPPPPLFT